MLPIIKFQAMIPLTDCLKAKIKMFIKKKNKKMKIIVNIKT